MKRAFYLCAILLAGCSNHADQYRDAVRNKWGYSHWGEDLKSKVLCDCVLAGINDKEISKEFFLKDRSFASPINFILFDSVSREAIKPIILQMKADSAKSMAAVAESAAGKKVFKSCLDFYHSAKLDSIVKSRYKVWDRITDIDTLVGKKVPSY